MKLIKPYTESLLFVSRKQKKSIDLFWLGFIIYTLSYVLSTTDIYVSYVACQIVQIAGIIIFASGIVNLIKFKFDDKYLEIMFICYFIWGLGIVARGFIFNTTFLKQMFLDPSFGMFTYFAPLLLLFPRNFSFYKRTFDTILIFCIFFILYNLIFINQVRSHDPGNRLGLGMVENFSVLSLPGAFILFSYNYHPNKKKILAFCVMVFSAYFALIKARRGLLFMCLTRLASFFMIYLIFTKKKGLIIAMSVILVLATPLLLGNLFKSNSGPFTFLMARGDEDTRSGVEDDFYDDMKSTKDWVIGKGINGEYFSPSNMDVMDTTGYRPVIETGYLQIILKGGLVSLILFLLITIPAVIKGFFYSKNMLSKGAAMWILLDLVDLYPRIINCFDMNYLLLWIAVGICYSKAITKLPEERVKDFFLRLDKNAKPQSR